MRKLIFTLIALNFIAFWAFYLYPKISAPRADRKIYQPTLEVENIEEKLWEIIQNWREGEELPLYIKSNELCKISEERANELGSIDMLDNHKGFINRYSNYPYKISENLSLKYYSEPEHYLNGWLHSPSHAAALHAYYAYSCVSCYQNVCVQIFSNFEQ